MLVQPGKRAAVAHRHRHPMHARAREQAAMLVDQAIAHLRGHGAEADLLRELARYVGERDR